MKRLIVVLLAGLLVCFALVGCGKKVSDEIENSNTVENEWEVTEENVNTVSGEINNSTDQDNTYSVDETQILWDSVEENETYFIRTFFRAYIQEYSLDAYAEFYAEIEELYDADPDNEILKQWADREEYIFDELPEILKGVYFGTFDEYSQFSKLDGIPADAALSGNIRFIFDDTENKAYFLSDDTIYLPKDMGSFFSSCDSVEEFKFGNVSTELVENMYQMFGGCNTLKTLDLSSFNTSKVHSMDHMFATCTHLESLDLTSFDTSNVTNMGQMFLSCRNLEMLDLSSFDTSNVYYPSSKGGGMFTGCHNLKTIITGDKWTLGDPFSEENWDFWQ